MFKISMYVKSKIYMRSFQAELFVYVLIQYI